MKNPDIQQNRPYCGDFIEALLKDDGFLAKLDEYGMNPIISSSVVLLHRGHQFKQSFLLTISNATKEIKFVVKAYKQNSIKRFKREIEPRSVEGLDLYGPRFVFNGRHTPKNVNGLLSHSGEYLFFIEEYVEGKDLSEIISSGDGEALTHTQACESAYLEAGLLMRSKLGRVLSNVNPDNIRISPNREKPVILDWGGQAEQDINWYRKLVEDRIVMPALAQIS